MLAVTILGLVGTEERKARIYSRIELSRGRKHLALLIKRKGALDGLRSNRTDTLNRYLGTDRNLEAVLKVGVIGVARKA